MPLVTSAIAAVSAAIASVSVATVAAATIAVSQLVAAVGLAVTAVGAVTGNKEMMKVGGIMGMVGVAGGLAGAGLGTLSTTASTAGTSVANQFANPQLAASITGSIEQAGKVGAGTVLAPATAKAAQVGAGSVLAPVAQHTGMINTLAPPVTTAPAQPLASTVAEAVPQAGVTAPASSTAGSVAPVAPAAGQVVSSLAQPGVGTSKVQGWWDTLPDWQKAQLTVTGGQAVAGLAGGFFEGLTAEEKIELDRLINSQNQTQRELINANNAYAPKLSFAKTGTGLTSVRR